MKHICPACGKQWECECPAMGDQPSLGLRWKLRRVGAGMRLVDVYRHTGINMTRMSLIEQGRRVPTELETSLIERALPDLPPVHPNVKRR